MSRPLRIQYPGALYHITVRGNERRNIFIDESDRYLFLSILSNVVRIHNLLCYAYCLMDNHFHLLIETPDANLSFAMHDLNGLFAQRFNKRHDRVGHLFQSRFHASHIEKESHLLESARYIVLNPVRAGLVADPGEWQWSSYNDTRNFENAPDWLCVWWILSLFAEQKQIACIEYAQFVQNGIQNPTPWNKRNGSVVGDLRFTHEVWEKTDAVETQKDVPRSERFIGRPTIAELFENVKNKQERNAAIKFARVRCGYPIVEIAKQINLDASTVGKIACGDKINK